MKREFSYSKYLIAILLAAIVGGCSTIDLASRWRHSPIHIDGMDSDWTNSLMYLEEHNMAMGLQHDGEYLYVCVKTADRNRQMQVQRLGLTVWLDATGSEEKTFGIHFPMGMQANGKAWNEPGDWSNDREERQFTGMFHEIEVVGPDKADRTRMGVINPYGISVAMSDTSGVLVYELKVPLKSTASRPFAIGSDAGGRISVGLETGGVNRELMKEQMGGGRGGMGGGRGGMQGGGRRGGMGQPNRQGMAGIPDPLKVWMNVTLAPEAEKVVQNNKTRRKQTQQH